MLTRGWRSVLVLGGLRSGKSTYAESLVTDADSVRRVSAAGDADLARLAGVLAEAKPDETLLIDPLDDWLPSGAAEPALDALAAAVRTCPARLVLVSPEVGHAVAPSTGARRVFAERIGALNVAVADAADALVLIVAGQPSVLKGAGPTAGRSVRGGAAAAPRTDLPDLSNLKGLPLPDDGAAAAAREHLASLGAAGLGALEDVVIFAAGTQGSAVPAPWQHVRALLLRGDHRGAAAAGAESSADRATQLRDGVGPVAHLAGQAGATVQIVDAATSAPIEDGPALVDEAAEQALAYGWQLAQQAADEGVDLLVLGSIGEGAETAAAAVTAAIAGGEPATLLGRVRTTAGLIDDPAWMRRCGAVRDAVYRTRTAARTGARAVLADLGGADVAIAAGVLLGAAARRTPVLLDGPVGAAGGLAARSLAGQSRHWLLLPDHNQHPTTTRAAEVLGVTPLLDLRLELGEGGTALAALPLLRTALALAATLPRTTPPAAQTTPGPDEPAESPASAEVNAPTG